ncbi:MAG TPA: glycosyltransferase [Candidatus Binataceae bacterium]|nr:glycosyltransferase [Candidatus Binataceae bacterium]
MRASVIIPAFNGAATIAAAIRSALDQRCADDFEIIVVNDGSTDGTQAILESFGDRLRIVNQPNRGLPAARNAAAAIAGGDYLALLDQDDLWLPEKLARTIAPLERDPDLVLSYSDLVPVDDGGAPAGPSPITAALARPPTMDDLLRQWWPILPSTVVIRHTTFIRCGGFFEGYRRAYEDVDFWLRARECGGFAYLAEPLVIYRTTPIHARMGRYEESYALFRRRIMDRYGARASALLGATRDAYVSTLGYRGLLAMRSGDRAAARQFFWRALRYHPTKLRTVLRLLRTFLPMRLARALSGSRPGPSSQFDARSSACVGSRRACSDRPYSPR